MLEKVIVEIKAQGALTGIDWAQVLNYLRASQFRGFCLSISDACDLEKKRMII